MKRTWIIQGVLICLVLSICGVCLPEPAQAQLGPRFSRFKVMQRWLRSEHQKLTKDCQRLVESAQQLREEAEPHKGESVSWELFERVQEVGRKALLLQAELEEVDENFLSVPVVVLAEEIREEGKALQKYFSDHLPDHPGKRLSSLADDVEDRADDVADRMRLP